VHRVGYVVQFVASGCREEASGDGGAGELGLEIKVDDDPASCDVSDAVEAGRRDRGRPR
jgi:hypothetical protein